MPSVRTLLKTAILFVCLNAGASVAEAGVLDVLPAAVSAVFKPNAPTTRPFIPPTNGGRPVVPPVGPIVPPIKKGPTEAQVQERIQDKLTKIIKDIAKLQERMTGASLTEELRATL